MKGADKQLKQFLSYMLRQISKEAGVKACKLRLIKYKNPKSNRVYGQVDVVTRIVELSIRNSRGEFYSIRSYLNTLCHEVSHVLVYEKYGDEVSDHGHEFQKENRKLRRKIDKLIRENCY